jgi:hypothetical protein
MLHVHNRSLILEAHNWRFTNDPQRTQNPKNPRIEFGCGTLKPHNRLWEQIPYVNLYHFDDQKTSYTLKKAWKEPTHYHLMEGQLTLTMLVTFPRWNGLYWERPGRVD